MSHRDIALSGDEAISMAVGRGFDCVVASRFFVHNGWSFNF